MCGILAILDPSAPRRAPRLMPSEAITFSNGWLTGGRAAAAL